MSTDTPPSTRLPACGATSRLPTAAHAAGSTTCDARVRARGRAQGLVAALWVVLALLGGCASVPSEVARPVSHAIAASHATPLGALAQRVHAAQPEPLVSGFRALPQADFALDARIELIRRARASLDLQYYLIGQDGVGGLLLHELSAAAARGVRVRLLVDDFYTLGQDEPLRALAALPNAQVRLFNPYTLGRGHRAGRLWQMATDFRRLNHRMHNKLLIADGAMAVFGGRNMADEYFQRHGEANFLDIDLLAIGPVVGELATLFDAYWNSTHVWPIEAVLPSAPCAPNGQVPDTIDQPAHHRALVAADLYGDPPLAADLDRALPNLIWAPAQAVADAPEKVGAGDGEAVLASSVTQHTIDSLRQARSEIVLVSPYFIPGERGLEGLRAARQAGVSVQIVTNSLAATDEPLVTAAYARYRVPLLQAGVELVELSPAQLSADHRAGPRFGRSRGSLHAKLAAIDRRVVWLGSMNLDSRSARFNTELGVRIDSPALAERIAALPALTAGRGAYRLRLDDSGHDVRWQPIAANDAPSIDEPETSLWQRLKSRLMLLFVAEDLL